MNNEQSPSVYRRGARDGIVMAAWLVLIFLCNVAAMHLPLLGLPALILLLLTPVPAYIMMKRGYQRYPSMRFFSAVWMHGIVIFFCGSLLLAPVIYVFLRFLQPDFLMDNVLMAIDTYRQMGTQMPEAAHMANQLQTIVDNHMLPTPISLAVTSIWTITFFGSLTSMVLTFIIRYVCRDRNTQHEN